MTVKAVHACCGMCHKAIPGLFKDAKVTFEGDGSRSGRQDRGKDLDKAKVIEALRKAGFNGKVD